VTPNKATLAGFPWRGNVLTQAAWDALHTAADGKIRSDLETVKGQTITCGAAVTIRADVGAAAAPGEANGMLIGGTNAATTFAAVTVSGLTTLTGAVSLGSTLAVAGTTTLAAMTVTNAMTWGSWVIAAAAAHPLLAADTGDTTVARKGSGTVTITSVTTELAKVPKSDGVVTWNATALASINAEVDAALEDDPTLNKLDSGIREKT
jgi:hypothetical protein